MDPSVVREILAAKGTLRAAINLGNAALAGRDVETGALDGVTVRIAEALAQSLDVPLDCLPYDGAGKVFADAGTDVWDIAFLAIDPERARAVTFSAPYVLIEAKAIAREDSPLRNCLAMLEGGQKIVVARNSAYDLYLTSLAGDYELVRYPTPGESFAAFEHDGVGDAVIGVAQSLEKAFDRKLGFRFLDGRVTAIEQAIAMPASKAGAMDALTAFIEARKSDGFVRQALDASGQPGLVVAPPHVR